MTVPLDRLHAERPGGAQAVVKRSGVIANIQVLRGVAALLVVFFHMDLILGFLGLPKFGEGGADIFFVISGFIMVYTTSARAPTPWSFMSDRIVRIVPLYWLLTLMVFALALASPRLLQATQPHWTELIQSLAFIPFSKSNGLVNPTLFVGWTLNYEMFFYLLFAVSLTVPNRKSGLLGVMLAIAALVLAGLVRRPVNAPGWFFTSPIMLEFALGMAVGMLHPRIPMKAGMGRKVLALATVIIGIAAVVVLPLWFPAITALLTCGLPGALVVGSALALERWGWSLRTRWLLQIGGASFSLYLIHPFVTQVIQKAVAHANPGMPVAVLLILATLASVILVGIFAQYTLERPLSQAARRLVPRRRVTA